MFPNIILKKEKDSIQNEIDRIATMFNHPITKILKDISLNEFKNSISSLYIVGVKNKWTVALYDDNIKNLLEKYNIKLEIDYGKDK